MRDGPLKRYRQQVYESYELGYLFGTFLGDGDAFVNATGRSEIGRVSWAFGPGEREIAEKLADAVESVTGVAPTITEGRVLHVRLYSLQWARLLSAFGKRDGKHLPPQYRCGNPLYLRGLLDGLVDSDGHVSADERVSFRNTSRELAELFGVLCFLLEGSFPSPVVEADTSGGLRGTSDEVSATVNDVLADSPAEAAGVKAGDRIVAIDGRRVDGDSIRPTIQASEGRPVRLTVQRGGRTVELPPVRPEKTEEFGVVASVGESFRVTWEVTKEIGRSVGRLVTGDGGDVSSPVGIVQGSSEAVEQGTDTYLWVLGLISLSLALLNLLPLLPLDGGHIAFSLVEGIRGRAVAREVYERVSVVGIAVVLLLFFIGLTNDIGRLGE